MSVHYRLVTGHAGIAWARRSSPFTTFGDANRAAMAACVEKNRAVRVYAYGRDTFAGDLVAEYVPVNGRPQSVPVEVPS